MSAGPPVAFGDLRAFIDHLDKRGRLRRVTAPVSRDLEIAEITDRVSKGPADKNVALLFENVHGFGIPVLINAFGAPDRMAAATAEWQAAIGALGPEGDDEDFGARADRILAHLE